MRTIEAPANPTDIFNLYTPPFRLLSEMLFGMAFCPTAPLRDTFTNMPFLSVTGYTPMVVWASTVYKIDYWREGKIAVLGAPAVPLYQELTMALVLRERSLFIPAIYANDALTLQIGWRYGMPKEAESLTFSATAGTVRATMGEKKSRMTMAFRPIFSLKWLSWGIERFFPVRTWKLRFPGGASIRATLTEAPTMIGGRISGELNLATPWLPRKVRMLPWGFYLPRQVMIMPPA